MGRKSDGEPCVTGPVEESHDHHCDEGNVVDEDMRLDNIVKEEIDMIIDDFGLNNIGETINTTMWRKKGHEITFKYFSIITNIQCHVNGEIRHIFR